MDYLDTIRPAGFEYQYTPKAAREVYTTPPQLKRWIEEYYSLDGHTISENQVKGYIAGKIADKYGIEVNEANRERILAQLH